MKGLGTNDKQLVSLITTRTNDQLQQVRREYMKAYGKQMINDVIDDTSGSYKNILAALLMSPVEFKSDQLYCGMKGIGTTEIALSDVLTQSTNEEIQEIKQYYAKAYGSNKLEQLQMDIVGDTSWNYKKTLLELLKGQRDQSANIDNAKVVQDAETFYKKGEGRLGTDDQFFVEFMTSKSNRYLQAVSAVYHQKYGRSIEQAIEAETSGDYKDALLALARPPAYHWAHRCYHAIKGLGTNDKELIRAFAMNNRAQLQEIAKVYQQLFKKKLAQDVADDTSFNFKKCLLSLLH